MYIYYICWLCNRNIYALHYIRSGEHILFLFLFRGFWIDLHSSLKMYVRPASYLRRKAMHRVFPCWDIAISSHTLLEARQNKKWKYVFSLSKLGTTSIAQRRANGCAFSETCTLMCIWPIPSFPPLFTHTSTQVHRLSLASQPSPANDCTFNET